MRGESTRLVRWVRVGADGGSVDGKVVRKARRVEVDCVPERRLVVSLVAAISLGMPDSPGRRSKTLKARMTSSRDCGGEEGASSPFTAGGRPAIVGPANAKSSSVFSSCSSVQSHSISGCRCLLVRSGCSGSAAWSSTSDLRAREKTSAISVVMNSGNSSTSSSSLTTFAA